MDYKAQAQVTDQDIIYIEQYANQGKSDQWIKEKLKIKIHIVQKYTTQYWDRKFKKNESKF